MQITLNIQVIILGAIIAQGLFAGCLLYFFKSNARANRFLAILLVFFSLWLCDTFFRVAGIFNQNPNYYFLPIYFSFAFGPLIYFYTRFLTEKRAKIGMRQLIHFFPALFQFSFYVFLQLRGYAYRRWFWIEVHDPYTYDLEFVLSLLSLLIYLFFSLRIVRSYQEWIRNSYSEISLIKLNWLKYIHLLLMILTAFWLIDAALRIFIDYYQETPLSTISIGFSVIFLAIGALTQKDLYNVRKEKTINAYHHEEEIDPKLLEKIQKAMQSDNLFLRNELTLAEFAKELGVPSRKLSRHINIGLELSFIDFVNGYRVAEVKKRIGDGDAQSLSLFGIALESGFNSKPTFNRVFKKISGMSPSQYLEKSQNDTQFSS